MIEREPELSRDALVRLRLTARQADVLAPVASGASNGEIAAALGTRPTTVAKHLQRVYAKLGVSSRTAAVHRARELSAGD